MHPPRLAMLVSAAALAGGCAAAPVRDDSQTLRSGPLRIQAGAALSVLGVTDDNHALYWDDGAVWATALVAGARRSLVASDVAQPPLVLVRGRAALVWTAQPFLGDLTDTRMVSPLVVWTAKDGARQASTASRAPHLFSIQAFAAVRPDSREIVFLSNVSTDGSVGDVVRASTDLARVTTLASRVDLSTCPPHIGYDRGASEGEPRIVVSACAPGATEATLSRWTGDRRAELTTKMRPGSWWTSDRGGKHLLVQLADNAPAVFTLDDAFTIVDDHRTAVGWITPDGTVFQAPRTSDTTREVFRISLEPAPRATRVTTLPAVSGFQFSNHLPYGLPYANVSTVPTAPDGSFMVAFTQFNTVNSHLTDSLRIDATATNAAPAAASAAPISLPAFEIATRDSQFHLFHVFASDGATASALHASNRQGETWQVSSGQTTLGVFGIAGSQIAFADRVTAGLFQGDIAATGDLVIADPASRRAPVTVARGARAMFFLTAARDAMVYASEADGAGPGLFVQRVP